MKRPQQKLARRRGAAAVEFALTAPLLFVFVFAGIEFARANTLRNLCDNSAMIAAREGILPGATASKCENVANNSLALMGVQNATVTVTPATITPTTPEVTVTVDLPLTDNALPMSRFVMGTVLSRSVTLKREVTN